MQCGASQCWTKSRKHPVMAAGRAKMFWLFFMMLFFGVGAGGSSSSCSASSSSRRLGSGAPWYCEEWERDHLEASSSAIMILCAVCFEAVYHHLLHKAEHSFVYGQHMLSDEEKDAAVRRTIFGKPLRLILLSRMGGEFMVLGFLAFMIWTCNQQGLWDELANVDSNVRLPTTGSDYLHLMEEVHMQLFVAMVLYFTLVFLIILGSDARIREFETSRSVWIEQLMNGTNNNLDTDARGLRAFKLWRGYFLKGCIPEILIWRERKPQVFQRIMGCLNVQQDLDSLTIDDLELSFTARFSFCTYLVFTLCNSVMDMIKMSHWTMCWIVVVKGFCAVLHRAGHVPRAHISPVMGSLCIAFILALYFATHRFKESLQQTDYKHVTGLAWLPRFVDWCADRFNPEALILTILQVLLFFLCHTWAGNMISKDFWNDVFKGDAAKIIEAIVYICSLCALAFVLPRCIPDFAAINALPPFFSVNNENVLELVAIQVVDSQMVKAREVVKQRQQEGTKQAGEMPTIQMVEEKPEKSKSVNGLGNVPSNGIAGGQDNEKELMLPIKVSPSKMGKAEGSSWTAAFSKSTGKFFKKALDKE